MWTLRVACLALAVASAIGSPHFLDSEVRGNDTDDDAKYTLPKEFLLGAGISAYQAEGAWDADGKGVNVFDYYYHSRNYTQNRTGDVSADHYHRYKEDIALAKKIGLQVFRLSISWARIFPNGTRDMGINKLGVDHYHDVIDELRKSNIEPLITIFHFDYPQSLEDKFGGWLSENMTDVFADYTDYLFEQYASKVKYWITINEASMYCQINGQGMVPPNTITTSAKKKLCLHNLLIGHAKTHKIYQEKYKKYNGLIGFGVGPYFSRPNSTADEDLEATEKEIMSNGIGVSIEPLVNGDYPEAAKTKDRPAFTDAQKELLKNTIDFAAVNIYRGSNVSASSGGRGDFPGGGGGPPDGGEGSGGGPPGGGPPGGGPPGGGHGSGGGPPGKHHHGGGGGDAHGSASTASAWALRELPRWVNKKYNIPVIISESGLNSGIGLNDWDTRAVFFSAFLRELAAGINEDGNKVIAFTVWSFIDSFEFYDYNTGWGMVSVDFENKTLERTLKNSWTFFKTVALNRKVPLVEAGSEPFPDPSGAATTAISGSMLLATAALLVSRWI